VIPDHTEALERLYRERLEDKPKLAPVVTPRSNGYAANSSGPSDADVTEKLLGERTDKGRRLWEGDTSGYESASEADLGLLEKLAFYTREVEQLERMWYESGLYRQKLARADYRQRTIAKALERVTETYDWSRLTVPGGFPRVSPLGRGCTADSSDSSDGFSKSSPLKNVPMFPTDALPSKVARYVEEAAASLSCSRTGRDTGDSGTVWGHGPHPGGTDQARVDREREPLPCRGGKRRRKEDACAISGDLPGGETPGHPPQCLQGREKDLREGYAPACGG
jgi:primase/DNA polymerase family protein